MLEEMRRAVGAELATPPVQEFVVLALKVVETAVVVATSEADALERYVLPEELAGEDIVTWAMPKADFEAQVKAAMAEKHGDSSEDCENCDA